MVRLMIEDLPREAFVRSGQREALYKRERNSLERLKKKQTYSVRP